MAGQRVMAGQCRAGARTRVMCTVPARWTLGRIGRHGLVA
jgi:hypothetical protein